MVQGKYVDAAVRKIYWERVTVHIEMDVDDHRSIKKPNMFEFFLLNEDYKSVAKFQKQEVSPGKYHLWMNVTNPGNCRCLPAGSYRCYLFESGYVMAKCMVLPEMIPELENASRSFLHNNRGRAYVITFSISEGEEDLPFFIHVMDSAKVPIGPETGLQIAKSVFWEPLVKLKKNIGRMFWKSVYAICKLRYRYSEHTLLFMTEQGDTLGANLTAVIKRLKERGLDSEYKILTSARPASYVRPSKLSNWRLIRKIAKSKYIFLDDHAPILDWLQIRDFSKVIQLWHAGAGFKSSGYSRWGHPGCPPPFSCHRQYLYGIAGSKHIAKFFAEVFGINEAQILPTGMPRMDEYLDPEYQKEKREQLYQEYPVCRGRKVILFAPTYRGRGRKDAMYPYEMIDFERLYDFCEEEDYVVLFKMHPWVQEPVPIEEDYDNLFIDVNKYPNINDLFYITDILITDYSSNIFEFSLMRKPMLFFAFDKLQYSLSRGFHRDYEEAAPGKVCYNFDELMNALEQEDYEYEKVEKYIDLHFDHIDCHASDRVIDWIILEEVPLELFQARIAWKDLYRRMGDMNMDMLRRLEEGEEV